MKKYLLVYKLKFNRACMVIPSHPTCLLKNAYAEFVNPITKQ